MRKQALKAAFPYTIPVLTGYLFLGMAYGILMHTKGYGIGWSIVMSVFVFAGSIQYVGITLLTSAFNPVYALFLTLMVNARHLFYGISMLTKYNDTGKFKPYLIFGLTDETFSIVCSATPKEGVDRKWFYFFVTLLDHAYWVGGTVLGVMIGSVIHFNTQGLDFVLTALFTVIFIDQWKSTKKHTSAVVGVGASVLCLVLFGQDHFILPAMGLILLTLTVLRKKIEGEVQE